VAVLAGCGERVSSVAISLIYGKMQGISSRLAETSTLHASIHKGLAVEFPTMWNSEFIDANTEFSLK